MMVDETCAFCGTTLPPAATYCGYCGEMVNRGNQIQLGSVRAPLATGGRRVLAYGIDLVAVYAVQFAFSLFRKATGILEIDTSSNMEKYRACIRLATTPDARRDCVNDFLPDAIMPILVAAAISFTVGMVYLSVCNALGTSPGKRAAGIRIVNAHGGRPGVWRGVLRAFAATFLSGPPLLLGYLWAFWDPQHRAWHDMIAGTRVIRVLPTRLGPPADAETRSSAAL